jgi:hypothetical protein
MRLLAIPMIALLSSAALARDPAPLSAAAMEDRLAWEIVEGLTTEIGPRPGGSAAEARARDWAVAKLKALGFSNVRVETFDVPYWERGEERAEIVGPFAQPLHVTALWQSAATPPGGVTAQVVAFDSVEALKAAPDAAVKGRIVFVDHAMVASQDGGGYGYFGSVRRVTGAIASRKGAVASVIRSLGTDEHRNPHTGSQDWSGATPIPSAALSVPDAQQLARILKRGKPVTMRLLLTPRMAGTRQSGNVIAEVPGRDPKGPVVLVGGHLDSWDLGTGAIDDGAGVAITTAAAKRIMESGRPLHTIRVVWFGSEEIGLYGGKAYLEKHPPAEHVAVAESDLGSDRVWRVNSSLGNDGVAAKLAAALAPMGIVKGATDRAGGSDIGPLIQAGAPAIELQQDATRYFDIHHTPDDTLDKVDPENLRQNVAAWTAMLAVIADEPALSRK